MNANIKKKSLWQFFTKKHSWLKQHIIEFIRSTQTDIVVDPFAGNGDIFLALTAEGIDFQKRIWYDIDPLLPWKHNDSLKKIPKIKNSIIITNPPYLTRYSAKRKGLLSDTISYYFNETKHSDLYQLAIEKCMQNDFWVMIVPETFINSSFPKHRIVSITIIEEPIFSDTDTPICVICYDNVEKDYNKITIYKNETLLGNLQFYEDLRKLPNNICNIKFNSQKGQIALRAVDTTNPDRPISFMHRDIMGKEYNLANIQYSSRLITLIEIDNKDDAFIDTLIHKSNHILSQFRIESHDIVLSPFKGNKKNGERRRRLDYQTARAILEDAYLSSSII